MGGSLFRLGAEPVKTDEVQVEVAPQRRKPVAVVYPYVPHYREPVFNALSNSHKGYRYVFFAGINSIDASIISKVSGHGFPFKQTPVFNFRGVTFQLGLLRVVLGREFDHVVFLGNPYYLTTWFYSLLARWSGKVVSFWTHGWLAPEPGLKGMIRTTFYRSAHGLLLYGNHAKEIGADSGFSRERMFVIFNSLNYPEQQRQRVALSDLTDGGRTRLPKTLQGIVFFACVARLTSACRFDLAIDALALLAAERDLSVPLALIGEGPEKDALEARAAVKGVEVVFFGGLYSEEAIGPVIFNSRAVVSPGKVGLTAMHSLAYGTPVLTHNNFNTQMPEFEAVVPALTGDFFQKDDVRDLARVMESWVHRPRTEAERALCVQAVESRYTPERQVEFIESALCRLESEVRT